ncbi:MAG: rhomboid family intramembrane serine protease [Pseudomonadota bacterium]
MVKTLSNRDAPTPSNADCVWLLIAVNALAYAAWLWQPGFIYRQLALWPLDGWYPFRPWQLLTYGFIHDRVVVLHLLLNMFALWTFGALLAKNLGRSRFLGVYAGCMAGAGITQLGLTAGFGIAAPTVGASGALFGLLAVVALRFGSEDLSLLFTPITLRARTLVAIIAMSELVLALWLPHSRIAHGAHLGGLLSGLLIAYGFREEK